MIDSKNAEITTTAVYNRLRELGLLSMPLDDEGVKLLAKETIKVLKAQLLVKKKLSELKLLT